MRRVACLVGLIGLLLPAAAQAWLLPTTDEARLVAYLPIARSAQQQMWPDSHCAGLEHVVLHADTVLNAFDAQDGVTSMSRGADDRYDDLSCTVWIRSGIPTAYQFCWALVHEFGNTSGHYDNATPGDVMNIGQGANGYEPCVKATTPPTATAAARYYVREMLPAPASAWRITCAASRCRAQYHKRTLHFKVLRDSRKVYGVEPL